MAGARARGEATGRRDAARARGRPKPRAKPAAKPVANPATEAAQAHSAGAAPCACGGDCPRCKARAAARRKAKARAAPHHPAATPDAAEREARDLGQRLRLIGEPAAPSQPDASATPPLPTAPRPALREIRAPHPRLGPARRLTPAERRAAEAALDLDLSAVRIHSGPVAAALVEGAGALAFTLGNHIVLGAAAERMSPDTRSRVLAHELIHVVQQSAPVLPDAVLPAPARHDRPQARGPPLRPRIRAPPQPQFLLGPLDDIAVAAATTVVDLGADAVGEVAEFAEDVGDTALSAAREAVDYLAPGLWDFLSGGAIDDLAGLLCQGVDLVLGSVFEGIGKIDIMSTLEATFAGLALSVRVAQATALLAVRNAIGALFAPFVAALEEWGGPLITFFQTLTSAVSGAFSSAWDSVAVPAMDFLEAAGGAVWTAFTDLVTWVWDLIEPLRREAAWAWEKVTEYFEIAWNSTADIRKTLEGYAKEAFDAFLKLIEPIKTPLMAAAGIFLLLSPFGPILIATQVLPPLYDKIKWLVQNWTKIEIVVEARQYLHDVILPGIMGLIGGVKKALVGAATWLAGVLGQLATAMVSVIGAFSGNECLGKVNKIIDHIDDQVARFKTWAEGGFEGLNEALAAALDALKAVFQPILDFLVKLLIVAANPFMLPFAITAAIWLLLPDRLKPPVIKFVLQLILAAVEAMPTFLPGAVPLAAVFKAAVVGFLRHLLGEGVSDDQRIAASNKIANLATGGSVMFVAGLAVGILEGLIDGILDPFKLLFMLFELVMKGIEVVGRVTSRLVSLVSPSAPALVQSAVRAVVGPPPPAPGQTAAPAAAAPAAAAPAAPAPEPGVTRREIGVLTRRAPEGQGARAIRSRQAETGVAATPATGGELRQREAALPTLADTARPDPAADPVRREIRAIRPVEAQRTAPRGGAGPGLREIRRASPAATAPPEARAPPQDTPAATPAAGPAEAPGEVSLDSELTDEQIAACMDPAALQGTAPPSGDAQITGPGLEQAMRGEVSARGGSIRGLARLLGDAWDALMGAAGRLGGMAAGWLMEFLALPDYQLGNKLGYLAGMVLLEVLISYFTAGGYMVIKEGAGIGARLLAYFLRFLDMGGAILGVLGKGLGKLRRPVMGGLDAASGFLSKFRFLDNVLGRVRGAADWLFHFGDEIGRAADIARRGTPDAAGHGVMGLADDAAEGVARGADDLPAALPRTASDLPAGPARLADDVPAGPARVADDLPAARAADDVPAARAADDLPAARAADDAVEAQADRAAREAIDDAAGHPPAVLDEAADGSRRTASDAPPTIRDEARRAAEFPVAIAAARQIAEINDAIDQPIPIVMGALLALKGRFRWIDHFTVRPLSGPGVYFIGMVASPQTPVDRHYSVHAAPEPPAPRAADPDAWRTPPPGARVVSDGPTHVVYEMPDGSRRIRFDSRDARTYSTAQPGRNQTDEARAALSPDGRPYVHEGRHRSVGAAKGDQVPEGIGGVQGHPEVLDYPFEASPAPLAGPNVRDLSIDYKVPDMDPHTLADYTAATDMRFTDPAARNLSGPARELGDTRRARQIADDVVADAANAPPTRVGQQPDGSLRADPAGHPPRADLDAKAGQLAGAITAAHSIVGLNDRLNTPLPAIMAQLMALKTHYRWIETFEVRPLGPGRWQFFMIASRTAIGSADLLDLPGDPADLPRGASVHADDAGTGYAPPRDMPPVERLPPGRPRRAAPEFSATPEPPARLPELEPPRRSTADEIAEDFSETTAGNGAMVPTGRSQNARIPDYPSRTERHTNAVMTLENNRVFGGTNEDLFTRYLDEGVGEAAERFDTIATQVYIRPITGWDELGRPIYAPYRVRADTLARDRATGGLQILDAKTTPRAPLTPNQERGYPLIAANGGRVETPGLPRGLAPMTDIDPTPVSRAIPTTNLRTGQVPPNGRPAYRLEPVPPAGGVGGPRVVPVTPRAHPAPVGPVSARAEATGTRIGEDLARTPPPTPARPPRPVGQGSLRTADDPRLPTRRNAAAKAARLPEALAAARAIIAAGDSVNLPAPAILAQLMLLRSRYRWIEGFRADPTGPATWAFVMIASQIRVASANLAPPLVLFHGSPRPGATAMAHSMADSRQGFTLSPGEHDLGAGLYLFEDRLGAAHYAGPEGVILRIEMPRPHPDDIADISVQGFGRNGLPGAERAGFLAQPGVAGTPTAEALSDPVKLYPGIDPEIARRLGTLRPEQLGDYREAAKLFTTRATRDPASPFFRNLARAQLFYGAVPDSARLTPGGLGFEYDLIQWRMREPTAEVRAQIIRQILGR
ncbi:MAG: DUF4157 domain-containing protein [Fuscovulum sp.]|nr:DUF4157 domain-containing protein [Fuscovulum sp.]